jgi:hypothetical protein
MAAGGAQHIVVIQDVRTGQYLKKASVWVPDVREAAVFEHILDASSYAMKARLKDYHIVMSFGDPRYDVRLDG